MALFLSRLVYLGELQKVGEGFGAAEAFKQSMQYGLPMCTIIDLPYFS